MKDSWWDKKAKDFQVAADKNNTKLFNEGWRDVYGPRASGSATVYSSDCVTFFTDKTSISNRWTENFSYLLNRPMSDEALESIPQRQLHEELDYSSSLDEVVKNNKQISNRKFHGVDGNPAEVFTW